MTDLRRATATAAINLAIDNQSTSDTGTDGDVKNRRQMSNHRIARCKAGYLAGAEQGFRQSRNIGIVSQHGGPAEQFADPVRQGKVVPAFDLVRLDDGPCGII